MALIEQLPDPGGEGELTAAVAAASARSPLRPHRADGIQRVQERLPDPSTSAGPPGGVARIVQGIEPDSLLRLRRLHALLGAHRRTRAEGGEVRFVVTGPAVRRILAIMAIDRVIPVFGRPDEALTPSARSDLSG